ncbi:hypothetical protein KHA80_12615 [Anaerobacillus sp. HL2]|nr:hypothetical protein KHA80_12615 [Anaerobacillus sp. HL2]
MEVSKVEFEPVKLEVRYDESKLHKTANDFLCAISKIENERKNYEKTKAMKYSTSLCQIVEVNR